MKHSSRPATGTDNRQLTGLRRYSGDVVAFIEAEVTASDGTPLVLEPHQKVLLRHCFTPGEGGRLPYSEVLYLFPKKSGKTAIAAGVCLWVGFTWERGPRRVLIVANSHEQAQEQVYADIVAAIARNPRLAGACRVRADTVKIADGSTIVALPCNPKRISGGRPTMVSQDEVWQVDGDATLTRVYEELSPDPSQPNAFRLITSHAGYTGSLLSRLFDRGMTGRAITMDGPPLKGLVTKARSRFFLAYDEALRMRWQTQEWVQDQRDRLSPETFERQVRNRFAEAQAKALAHADVEAAFDTTLQPYGYDESLPPTMVTAAGLDIGTLRDASACCVVGLDTETGRYRLLRHKLWVPSPGNQVWLPDIAEWLEEVHRDLGVQLLCFDPDQCVQLGQEFGGHAIPITQTVINQSRQVQVLLSAFQQRRIDLYPDALDLAGHLNAVDIEKLEDGYRLRKSTKGVLIDAAVALSLALMGCAEALKMDLRSTADFSFGSGDGTGPTYTPGRDGRRQQDVMAPQTADRLARTYPAVKGWPEGRAWLPLAVPVAPLGITSPAHQRAVIDATSERHRREARRDLLWERHRPKRPGAPPCTDAEYWLLHDACWPHGGLGDVNSCPTCKKE